MTYEKIVESWNQHCVGSSRYNTLVEEGFVLNAPIDVEQLPDSFYMGAGCYIVRGSFVLPNGKLKYWGIPNNPKASILFDADAWDNCLKQIAVTWKLERPDDTATPRTFNHMKDGLVYVPEKSDPVRPGAMDALKIQSRGYPT